MKKKTPRHSRSEQLYRSITLLVRVALLTAVAIATWRGSWETAFASAGVLLVTYLPRLLEKSMRFYIPTELQLAGTLLIYATLFLGEIEQFYQKYAWWDLVAHTGSAIVFGVIGFMILYFMTRAGKVAARPITIAIFSFCFAVAIGTLWEILEFAADQFLGTNMQKSGLVDTMTDLAVNSLGALYASALGYFYLRGVPINFLHNLLNQTVKDNPHLFKAK